MKNASKLLKLFLWAGIILFVPLGATGQPPPQSFLDDFTSSTLDPAWQVVAYTGPFPRAHGFTSAANDFSLTANPGHLRYLLIHMTHFDGYLNNYQTTFSFHSCCNHDPGLELHRTFSGDRWLFEAKASYFMPFANGRLLDIRIYFGDGAANTFYVAFQRHRDGPFPSGTPETIPVRISLTEKFGPTLSERSGLEFVPVSPNPAGDTYYYRFERAGNVLTAMWSYDGVTWNTAFSRNMGTQLDGLGQRVVLTGLSWFVPAGSYADYDYVSLTPTVIPVEIDIKPGSDPNSINLGSAGVVPVAILSSDTFDATTVDPDTVSLAGASVKMVGKSNKFLCNQEDVNGDGLLDLVCKVETAQFMIDLGESIAVLEAETFDGQKIRGEDFIRIVP